MRRAQSTLEYVYILGICIVALIALGIYVNRGFQGRYRDLGEQLGPQYSPANTVSHSTNQTISDTTSVSTSKVKKYYSDSGVTLETQSQINKTSGYNQMHQTASDETGSLEAEE